MEKKIKTQKIIISILVVIILILSTVLIITTVKRNKELNTYSVTFANQYTNPPSLYPYYEITVTCKKEIKIKVKDFSFKINDNDSILLNTVTYNGKEYNKDESFIVYPYKENKIIIHRSAGYPQNDDDIYFKGTKLKFLNAVSFYDWKN